jgi:hypothetical protein
MKKRIGLLLAITIAATLPMAHGGTFVVKDGAAATKYMKTEGTGTSGDPYVPHHAVSDGTDIAGVDTAGADAGSNTSNRLAGSSWLHGYNGTTWDRIRAGLTGTTATPTGFLNNLPYGQYNATPLSLADTHWASLQLDSAGALKVNPGTVAVTGTFWQATQPISASSLPLPSGAATAAKQPALGTAGSASSDVITVQGIASMTALKVDGSAVTQPVSGTITANLAAGTNAIGKLSANSGVDIGDVDVTSVVPGTGASSLGKAEDAAHSSGDTGIMMLGVRNDGGSSLAGTTGDYIPLTTDSSGALRITGGGGGTEYTEGDTDSTITGGAILWEDSSDTLRPVSSAKPLPVNVVSGSAAGTEYTEDAAAAGNPAGPMSMAVRADSLAAVTTTDGDNIALRATNKGELYVKQTDAVPVTDNGGALTIDNAGTFAVQVDGSALTSLQLMDDVVATDGSATPTKGNLIAGQDGTNAQTIKTDSSGELQVDVLTLPSVTIGAALPAGTNAIGKLAANDGVDIGDVTITNASIPVTDNGGSLTVDGTVTASNTAGDVAHDSADSGNPVKIGAVAKSADPTAVANGDRANLYTDLNGKLIVMPYTLPENQIYGSNASAITDTTSTSIIAAAGAGIRNYITSILVTNSHATVGTLVKITDGSGGTLLAQGYAAPAGGGWSLALPVPIKTTANTALHAICGTTGANVYVTAVGYKAP